MSAQAEQDGSAPAGRAEGGVVVIDARAPMATGVVCGLPQVVRNLRLAARTGCTRALVWTGPEPRVLAELKRCLLRAAVPPRLEVRLVQATPAATAKLRLDGHAVYATREVLEAARAGCLPAPLHVLHAPADLAIARRLLVASIRKPVELDGVIAYHLMRPLSRQLTRVLVGTPVTPNQVTLVAMALGLAAAVMAAFASGPFAAALLAAAGISYWVGSVVDCVDGELARLRVESSPTGEWLDTIADDLATYGLLAGLGVGLSRDGAATWAWLAVGAAALGLVVKAVMYWDLHRQHRPIDTGSYPWFFGDPDRPRAARSRSLGGTVWYGLEFLFRRDVYCTLIALLLLVPLPREVCVALAVGALAPAPLLAVHFAVMRTRRSRAPETARSS